MNLRNAPINPRTVALIVVVVLAALALSCGKSSQSNVSVNTNSAPPPPPETPKMNEINHNLLSYSGNAGQEVNLRVEADKTNHMVTYTIDGGPIRMLKQGDKIKFNLKSNAGEQTVVQINLEFTAAGSYDVVVENVGNCIKDTAHNNECPHRRFGPQGVTLDYRFVVQ